MIWAVNIRANMFVRSVATPNCAVRNYMYIFEWYNGRNRRPDRTASTNRAARCARSQLKPHEPDTESHTWHALGAHSIRCLQIVIQRKCRSCSHRRCYYRRGKCFARRRVWSARGRNVIHLQHKQKKTYRDRTQPQPNRRHYHNEQVLTFIMIAGMHKLEVRSRILAAIVCGTNRIGLLNIARNCARQNCLCAYSHTLCA